MVTLELDDEGFVVRVSKFSATTLGHVKDDGPCASRWRARWALLRDEWNDAGTQSDEIALRTTEYLGHVVGARIARSMRPAGPGW